MRMKYEAMCNSNFWIQNFTMSFILVEGFGNLSDNSFLSQSLLAQTPGHNAHDTIIAGMHRSVYSADHNVVVHGQCLDYLNILQSRNLRHLTRHQLIATAHEQPVTHLNLPGLYSALPEKIGRTYNRAVD